MPGRVSKWLTLAGAAIAALSAVLVAGAAIVHASWNGERAARSISHWASKTLSGAGGPTNEALVIERVDYALWPALRSVVGGRPVRVQVWGFHIWDPDGHEVLGARHVETGLRLGRLVWHVLWGLIPGPRGDLELWFVDAIVDEVHADLEPDRAGDVNLFAAFKRRAGTESRRDKRGGIVIDVDHSVVRDATFRAKFSDWSATLEHGNIDQRSLHYSSFRDEQLPHAPAFTFRVDRMDVPRGQIAIDELRFPIDHVAVGSLYAEEPTRADIHFAASAHCLDAKSDASGALLDVYSHDPALDVHAAARHSERVLAMLPSKKFLSGDAAATLHVSGPMHAAKLEGTMRGLEGKFLHLELHDGSGHYRLEHDKLTLTQLHTQLGGGSVDGDAKIAIASRKFELQLRPTGIRLAELGRFALVELASAVAGLAASPATDGSGELQNHLVVHGIDVTLYRREHTQPPDRVRIHN